MGESLSTDVECIACAKTGDDQAFRQLVERYEGQVAATVVGMLGAGAEAEDVGQDVFIRFYESLDKFRGDSAVGTYLTRIAINLSLNAVERRKRMRWRFWSRDEAEDQPEYVGVDGREELDERFDIFPLRPLGEGIAELLWRKSEKPWFGKRWPRVYLSEKAFQRPAVFE